MINFCSNMMSYAKHIVLSLILVFIAPFVHAATGPGPAQVSGEITEHVPPALEGSSSPFIIKPVSRITLESFYYPDYANKPYCFENAEGRCLTKKFQEFTDIEGYGKYGNRFSVYYRTQVDQDGQFTLKKAYGVLRTGIWSWEVGKDTVWMGPGYHGSFLLSNNAEGFLLVRVRTEEPFRFPWIFSRLGEFKYDLFRGWSDNSSLLGQRLSWRPVKLLEIGANQVVYIPPGKRFAVYDYPHVFVSSNENVGSQRTDRYNNDQKASVDIALDMPFLDRISPFVTGRVYGEYGGNDFTGFWQQGPDKRGFKFVDIAWLAGLFLTTGDVDFRFEYANQIYPPPWYTELNTRMGQIMGYYMGGMADDLFFETTIRHKPVSIKIFCERERQGVSEGATDFNAPPETKYGFGLTPAYQFERYTFFTNLIYNHYHNVNFSNDPVQFDIHPGTNRDEFIAGLGVAITF